MMCEFLPEGRIFQEYENQRLIHSPEGLREAMERRMILEAIPIRCDTEHTLHFSLGGLHAVMRREECAVGISEGLVREIAILSRVGKPTCFTVEALTAEDGRIIPRLSRRTAQLRALEWLLTRPHGEVIPATVTHLERFGAFVDVGCGVVSLIPLDRISVSRITHPSCRFRTGDEIFAVIIGTLPEQNRLLLSHRELMGTWAENVTAFSTGEVVTGTVRGVLPYGIFVELAPNLPALAEFVPGFENGDRVSVFIKSILYDREKIKLLILDHAGERIRYIPPVYLTTSGNMSGWVYHTGGGQKID